MYTEDLKRVLEKCSDEILIEYVGGREGFDILKQKYRVKRDSTLLKSFRNMKRNIGCLNRKGCINAEEYTGIKDIASSSCVRCKCLALEFLLSRSNVVKF